MITVENQLSLQVTQFDLDEYFFSLSNQCRIWKFRKEIVKRMDPELLREFKTKFNQLKKDKLSHSTYFFQAEEASTRLNEFLSNFKIILITKNNE